MRCCNKFLRIYLKNIYIMASGQRRLGTNSLVRSYNNIVEPVYLYIYKYKNHIYIYLLCDV